MSSRFELRQGKRTIAEVRIGILSTCLPTLRPLYSIAVHGHYCRSNEYCARCYDALMRPNDHPSTWKLWKISSNATRQSSDQAATIRSNSEKTDVEARPSIAAKEVPQIPMFSIMDRPL